MVLALLTSSSFFCGGEKTWDPASPGAVYIFRSRSSIAMQYILEGILNDVTLDNDMKN